MLIEMRLLIKRIFASSISRETLGTMGLKFASVGLTFLSTVLLARVLGPTNYGEYVYIYALISLLSVPSEFGLTTLVVRETARGMAQKDYPLIQGVWHWSGRMTGIISLALIILSIVAIFIFEGPFTNKYLDTFLFGLVLVPLIALGDLRGAALRGLQRVVAGQLPEFLIRPFAFVFLLVVFMWLGVVQSAAIAMLFFVIAAALAFGTGIWLLWRETPSDVMIAAPRYENHTWLFSAIPLALAEGMGIINLQASTLLQGFFLTNTDIGVFRVAMQVSQLAAFGLLAINLVVAPRFAELYFKGNMQKLQKLVTRSAQIVLAINLLITVAFVLLGKPLLREIFGEPYTQGYIPLLIMLGGQLVNSGVGSVGLLLNMTHFERDTTNTLMLAVVINIVLNVLLMPKWGIVGSAIATAISMIFWNILLWIIVNKKLHINSNAFFVEKIRERSL